MGDIDRHLLVFGKLKLPRGAHATWREMPVHAAQWKDWPDLLEGGHLEALSVREVLDRVTGLDAEQGQIVVSGKEVVVVRGYLLEPGTLAWSRDVAAPFRIAGKAGAKGEVTFLQVTGEGGARLVIDAAEPRFEELLADEAMELLAKTKAGDALGLYTMATSPPTAQAAPAGVHVHPEIREDLREALARASLVPLADLETDVGIEVGFAQLAEASPEAAAPIALHIYRSGHNGMLATHAGAVLNGSEDPAVAQVLLDYAAPADRASPGTLLADVGMIVRKPSLSQNIASLRVPHLDQTLRARFDALLLRDDSNAGLGRLTDALLARGQLDPGRAVAVAERLPVQYGGLIPQGRR